MRYSWPGISLFRQLSLQHVSIRELACSAGPGACPLLCRGLYWRITASSRPTVDTNIHDPRDLSYEVALPFTVDPSQVDGALALDVSDHLRHPVLGGSKLSYAYDLA
jgi:hypothetical protein